MVLTTTKCLRGTLALPQLWYACGRRTFTRSGMGAPSVSSPAASPPRSSLSSTGGLDVIRKEAWPFYRTSSGVRLFWQLAEPKRPKGRADEGQSHLEEERPASGLHGYLAHMVILGGGRFLMSEGPLYMGTSLMRNTPLRGPYSRTIPRVVWWS